VTKPATSRLSPRPATIAEAKAFVTRVHRKRPRIQGGLWAVAVERDGKVVGVAIVARPAVDLDDGRTLNVARVAVIEGDASESGNRGACSMLYGRIARVAKALGARLYTYTEAEEPGVSLRAAGWIDEGVRPTGIDTRPNRQVDLIPKRRWRAP
jgi:hypothetical protein